MSQRIKALLSELKSERDAIAQKSTPLRKKRDELRASIQPTEAQIYELSQQIKSIEGDSLVILDKQIGQLHRSLGAKSLSAEGEAK